MPNLFYKNKDRKYGIAQFQVQGWACRLVMMKATTVTMEDHLFRRGDSLVLEATVVDIVLEFQGLTSILIGFGGENSQSLNPDICTKKIYHYLVYIIC